MNNWSNGGHRPQAQDISSLPAVESVIAFDSLVFKDNDSGKVKQTEFSTAASTLNPVALSKPLSF